MLTNSDKLFASLGLGAVELSDLGVLTLDLLMKVIVKLAG